MQTGYAPRRLPRPDPDPTLSSIRTAMRRRSRSRQRARGWAFSACLLVSLVWGLAVATGGREPLGAYAVPALWLAAGVAIATVTR
ncbi:MAG: hypothetical protein KGK07_07255 [Chloroflexota bacterium]|nr:hypothetical protein [Chloroflexota bacterium]